MPEGKRMEEEAQLRQRDSSSCLQHMRHSTSFYGRENDCTRCTIVGQRRLLRAWYTYVTRISPAGWNDIVPGMKLSKHRQISKQRDVQPTTMVFVRSVASIVQNTGRSMSICPLP